MATPTKTRKATTAKAKPTTTPNAEAMHLAGLIVSLFFVERESPVRFDVMARRVGVLLAAARHSTKGKRR